MGLFPWSFWCWVGSNTPFTLPPPKWGHGEHTEVWTVRGHATPWPREARGSLPRLASCCFRSALRVESLLFSPPLEARSSHCARLGGEGVNRYTAVTSETDALVYSEESLLAQSIREAKSSGSSLGSRDSAGLLWALPAPHTFDLSKETSRSLVRMDGLWDSSPGGVP